MRIALHHLKPWHKLLITGALAAVMGAVPLAQQMQRQQAGITVTRTEQTGIDPLRLAVALQKGLQVHRGLAGMVLGGNGAVEAERRARRAEVDAHVAKIATSLTTLGFARALDAHQRLSRDWEQLALKVEQRAITPVDSFNRHSALVDQTLQVIDLLADASGLSLDPVAESRHLATAAVEHLPRLAEALSRLHHEVAQSMAVRAPGTAQRARLDVALLEVQERQSRVGAQLKQSAQLAPEAMKDLVERVADAEATIGRFHEFGRAFAERGKAGLSAAEAEQLAVAAWEAPFTLADGANDVLERLLEQRVEMATLDRNRLLAVVGAIAALAIGLALALARSLTRPLRRGVDAAQVAGDGDRGDAIRGSGSDQAARLLQRLAHGQGSLRQRRADDGPRRAEGQREAEAAQAVAGEIAEEESGARPRPVRR